MKYIINNENESENLVALHLNAFNKHVGLKSNILDDVVVNIKDVKGYQVGYVYCPFISRIFQLQWHVFHLFQGCPFYESHEFSMLFIIHLLIF